MPVISGHTVVLADRVLETTQTTGTGTYSLDGVSVTGRQSFLNGIGNGNKCPYVAQLGSNWEVGVGTVTSGAPVTLSRDEILASSNSDVAVNWTAGVKDIWVDGPAALLTQIVAPTRVEDLEERITELNGQIDAFQGAKMLFMQATAPTGWTQDTSEDDRVVRIIGSGSPTETGGATGGSWTISGVTTDGHALTVGELPSHSHSVRLSDNETPGTQMAQGSADTNQDGSDDTGNTGSGNPHSHGVSSDASWRPAFQNAIVCEADTWLVATGSP